MELKEFKLSLLVLGWKVEIDNSDSIFWRKDGETLQWDRDQDEPLFRQMMFHEGMSQAHRNILGKKDTSPVISYTYTSFDECIQEVSR